MATKTASKSAAGKKSAAKRTRAKSSQQQTEGGGRTASARRESAANPFAAIGESAKMAREAMTPEQAFELYRQNARLALDIIDAAIESTAKMRKLQFEGEEEARGLQKRAARRAAEAENPQALVAAGQNVGQEAIQQAMTYWSQMFDLVVEMQRRLFTIIDEQVAEVPGVKQARAALSMLPDLRQAQKLVTAMQGVLSSGSSTFESMQRVMGDFTKMAHESVSGTKR